MIEELFTIRRDTCRNCGEPVALMHGDLTGDRWYHDHGTRHCAQSPLAEPLGPPPVPGSSDRTEG